MRTPLLAAALAAATLAPAQPPRQAFKADIRLSAGNLLAYPGPDARKKPTPPPDSLKPFYISHYGCHGSRFLASPTYYQWPLATLQRADSLGKLTLRGRDALRRLRWLEAEARGQAGGLTGVGLSQHRGIARRMHGRFAEVFAEGSHVDASCTAEASCTLSMEEELHELLRLSPGLSVSRHALRADTGSTGQAGRQPSPWTPAARRAWRRLYDGQVDTLKLVRRLFSDMDYVRANVPMRRLNDCLFRLASATQNSRARYKVTLYDLFDDRDVYANWLAANAARYIAHGCCPMGGGRQPLAQATLLRRIVAEADSCIGLPHPSASLRFGNATALLALVCLIDVNGYGLATDDIGKLDRRGWADYRAAPMAGNVQMVFYRKSPADADPLVKLLLNENEATLPLKAAKGPYYRWSDVRKHLLSRIAALEAAPAPQAK